jgi:hypothetical protein
VAAIGRILVQQGIDEHEDWREIETRLIGERASMGRFSNKLANPVIGLARHAALTI